MPGMLSVSGKEAKETPNGTQSKILVFVFPL
jgi:hypothetical protein